MAGRLINYLFDNPADRRGLRDCLLIGPIALIIFLSVPGCAPGTVNNPTPSAGAPKNTPSIAAPDSETTIDGTGSYLTRSVPPTISPVPTTTDAPIPTPTPTPLVPQFASLDDFWDGKAEWLLDVEDTGLPLGESDTIQVEGDEFWSFLHASYQSAAVIDQCGDPVPFPGCTTLWKSSDGGKSFSLDQPVCLFSCNTCPCENSRDHIEQQQYPRVFVDENMYLVYEFGAYVYLRTSEDGLSWTASDHVPGTWIWDRPYGTCEGEAVIGLHPHIHQELQYDCLVGGPPGIFIEDDQIYVFVALGQAPGRMGCLVGDLNLGLESMRPCQANPLFQAENGYGPVDVVGPNANPFFEFRTISSADVVKVGDHYYMTYEGVRGPSSYTVVDDQFGLGLARSAGPLIDGPWEKYPHNPIINDLPGNVGLGHADLLVVDGVTYLYTATPDGARGRYVLVKK